jgi:hypothetical protein
MASGGADIVARQVELVTLLDGIRDGSVLLPDFQRDFEWSEGEVASLVATIMMGWPAGSLLLMRGSPTFFQTRAFVGVNNKADKTTYVVLDGQQRLTALYNAMRGAGEHRYAVDLTTLDALSGNAEGVTHAIEAGAVSAEDIENAIDVRKKDRPAPADPLEEKLQVPLTALASAADYFEWRDRYLEGLKNRAGEPAARLRLTRAYKDFLGTANVYQFPAVVLENDLPAEAVARIFERINRGGIELSTFDLLVARAYSLNWNLRDEWQRARDELEYIEPYLGDDGLVVLQGLALREEGDIRRPAVLKLSPAKIQTEWEDSALAMEMASEFVMGSGMRSPKWLPYRTLLIPLAALARDHDLEAHREVLESWLWARSLGMDYDVASSTKIAADYRRLDKALTLGDDVRFDLDVAWFNTATRRQHGALWRSFMSLLLRRGARDPFTSETLMPEVSSALPTTATLFSKTGDEPSSPHLRVFGQFLVQRGGAKRFKGRAVLAAMRDAAVRDPHAAANLASQFLPDPSTVEWTSDYEQMIALRLNNVVQYVVSELPRVDLVRSDQQASEGPAAS